MDVEDESGADLLNSLSDPGQTKVKSYEELCRRRKNMTHAVWHPELQLAEVIRLTGNFWKNHGFCIDSKSYLYPEEALYLFQKDRVYVELDSAILEQKELYDQVLQCIPHSNFLTYLRLKSLEYIVTRHTTAVRSFDGDNDIYDYLRAHPTETLLDALVSYRVYAYDAGLVKHRMPEATPSGYVVCMTGTEVPSPRVVMTLLAEAKGVPVIFAIFLPSGNVVLKEFADADTALAWKTYPAHHSAVGEGVNAGAAVGAGSEITVGEV